MRDLIEQLRDSLIETSSDASLRAWAQFIVENDIGLLSLSRLIEDERVVAMRFSWLIGGLCELKPEVVFPAVSYFYAKRNGVQFANFNRSLAKMFWLCGIPEEIEGEAIDDLFKWLMDAKTNVSAKVYAMEALNKLTAKYSELKNELKLVIEDQLGKNSVAFEKRAVKILSCLK